jgi:hypothetical protein
MMTTLPGSPMPGPRGPLHGWEPVELFGIDPVARRALRHARAAFMLVGGDVVTMDDQGAVIAQGVWRFP